MNIYGKVLIGLGCGIAAGTVLGILFAPGKGSETMRKISEGASDFSGRMKKMKDSFAGKVKVAGDGMRRKSGVEEVSMS